MKRLFKLGVLSLVVVGVVLAFDQPPASEVLSDCNYVKDGKYSMQMFGRAYDQSRQKSDWQSCSDAKRDCRVEAPSTDEFIRDRAKCRL